MCKRVFFQSVQVIFAGLMGMIAIATIVLDKNVDSIFPNTVVFANGVYYLAAFIVIWLYMAIHRRVRGQKDIDVKVYRMMMVTIPLAVWAGWQLPIARWIYWFTNEGDFGSIMYAAIGFHHGADFTDFQYFFQSPNNANLAIVLSWIYKIIPDWRGIILMGATLTNISAVLVSLSVKKISKNRLAGILTLVLAELLMAMNWRAFMVYTDNFGMIFVALILWVYASGMKEKYKVPIMIVLAAMGTFIKATVFICLLAILIHRFFVTLSENQNRVHKLKESACVLLWTVIVFGAMIVTQSFLRKSYGLDLAGQYPKGWQYMFMVGQNTKAYGVTNSIDPGMRDAWIEEAEAFHEDLAYVNDQFLAEGIKRVRGRGILGNVIFYLKKLNVAYNDGYFHNVQVSPPTASHELSKNIWYRLLWKEEAGVLYQLFAGILQTAWDAVLLCLIASVFLCRKHDSFKLFEILISGITLYVLLFEGRSKYLYMFLPVYLCAAGMSFAACSGQYTRVKNALIYNNRQVSKQASRQVGILTFHFVNNFGGALQAYALRKVVEKECHADTVMIDYRNWFIQFTDAVRLLPLSLNKQEVVSGLKTMRQRVFRRRRFESFVKENQKLSRRYNNHWQMNNFPPGCDKYICGSDQIWNPFLTMGIAPNYFLAFEPDADRKIAYAPSFGTDHVAFWHRKRMAHNIKAIGCLSVREKSGQELVKRLTGKDAHRLIDPVFLIAKEDWEQIGVNPLKTEEPYILLYMMQRDMEVYEYAKKIKKQLGIKLVEISRYGYQPGFVDETLIDIGPYEFLGLFKDAAYVCTNSYHGLAYSVIFEKEFCIVPCKRFQARMHDMLVMFKISNAADRADRNTLTAVYDKEYARAVIKAEKEKAVKFLVESVGK